MIASFICDSSDISDIKVLNDSNVDSGYASSVINGLQDQGKRIAYLLKGNALNYTSEREYLGKYYIAFNFILIDFYDQVKSQMAVPIIKSTIPVLDNPSPGLRVK